MNITFYENIFFPIFPENQISINWLDLVEILTTFNKVERKEDAPLFNMWQFKTIEDGAELGQWNGEDVTGSVRRCSRNCLGLWGLVVDYDSNKTMEEVVTMLDGFEFVIYTTFSHSKTKDKFRVILPFDRMMTVEEFKAKSPAIEYLFEGSDHASYSQSQAIYLHSGVDEDLAFSAYCPGIKFKVSDFEDAPALIRSETVSVSNVPPCPEQLKNYKERILESLKTCSGVRRGASARNGGILTLAVICKSVNSTFGEFCEICNFACASDSSGRNFKVQQAVWNGVKESKITKEVRNNFIISHGGMPVLNKIEKCDEIINELEFYIKELK
jgi:hypothetical protein